MVVCTEDKSILDDVKSNGAEAILTGDHHQSGTDRIFEAYKKLGISDIDYILNLQGDEPLIEEEDIIELNNLMIKNNSDIGTLASEIKQDSILNNENIVKVITKNKISNTNFPLALDFKRKVKDLKPTIYHHLGIYGYKPDAVYVLPSHS